MEGKVKISLDDYNELVNTRIKHQGLVDGDLIHEIYLTDGYLTTSRFDHDRSVIVKTLKEVESDVIKLNEKQQEVITTLSMTNDQLRRDITDLHQQLSARTK